MKTKAVRLHGREDLRFSEFELPPMDEGEILARVVSDSLCMSTYKAYRQGSAHRAVPEDVAENPTIVGHELCGEILAVGRRWRGQFAPGQKFTVQPNLGGDTNPGYSFPCCGGNSQYILLPEVLVEKGCLLPYAGGAYFYGSLAEPMSCIIGAFHTNFHKGAARYTYSAGVKSGGRIALLAAGGPMGLGAIDYALHGTETPPRLLVVTELDRERLARARAIYPPEAAARQGTRLCYVDASAPDATAQLLALTDGQGYDDIFVFAAAQALVGQAGAILARDGCINFFAGPVDHGFSAPVNFYDVHYKGLHVCGNSGGDAEDMREALALSAEGRIDPASMVTHIGGLDAVVDTIARFPEVPGGKKLIYNFISLPLTAIADLPRLGRERPLLPRLAEICAAHRGLWNAEAEASLLGEAPAL